jgi:hypothetical protein
MLKKMIKRVLFGKKRTYNRRYRASNYITWQAHERLSTKVDNLIKHLGLTDIKGTCLIGDQKDAKKFDSQWNQ